MHAKGWRAFTADALKWLAREARLAVFADRLALTNQKLAMALITYIAEDNDTILTNLIETLQEITEVRVVGSGATQTEAERWLDLHDGSWHLAIVDLFLKQGSGLAVLTDCHKREPYQKVVLLTNYATPEIRKRALLLGADAVFDKSNQLDELLAYCIKQTEEHKKFSVQEAERVAAAPAVLALARALGLTEVEPRSYLRMLLERDGRSS